jgi:hypothetical protein
MAIKKLIIERCANYDTACKQCLPLEWACFMLSKWCNAGCCKYFINSVLPNNPALQASLTGGKTRKCLVCGAEFFISGKKEYCSPICAKKAHRRQQREFMRKKRW